MHWSVGKPSIIKQEVSACGCLGGPMGNRGMMPDGVFRQPKQSQMPMTRDRSKVTCGACKRTRRWKEES